MRFVPWSGALALTVVVAGVLAGCAGTPPPAEPSASPPAIVASPVSASQIASDLHLDRYAPREGRIVLAADAGDAILIFPETTVVSVRGTQYATAEPIELRGDEAWLAKSDADAIERMWRTILPSEVVVRPAARPSSRAPSARGVPYSDQPSAYETKSWSVARLTNDWRYIVIHHSATESGSAATFDKAHRARGWDGLGYDFVIGNGSGSGDGAVAVGYRWRQQKRGAHAGNEEFNEHGIGICLVGDFTRMDPTPAQMRALSRLCNFLSGYCHISRENFRLHGDVKTTTCPGPRFPRDFLSEHSGLAVRSRSAGSDAASGSGR